MVNRRKTVRDPLPPKMTKRRMAREAGMSLHQLRQAVLLANMDAASGSAAKGKTRPCHHCGGSGKISD